MKIVIWQLELVGQTGRVIHLRIVEKTPKNSEFLGRVGEKTEILRRYRKKMKKIGRGLREKLVQKGCEKGGGSL
jgi:hypothetical protein